jgi:hypothetical protein
MLSCGEQAGYERKKSCHLRGGSRAWYEETYLANRYQIPFMETSAKTSQNVNNLFDELTKQMVRLNQGNGKSNPRRPPLPLKPSQEE